MTMESLYIAIAIQYIYMHQFDEVIELSTEDEKHKKEVQAQPTQGDQYALVHLSVTYPQT